MTTSTQGDRKVTLTVGQNNDDNDDVPTLPPPPPPQSVPDDNETGDVENNFMGYDDDGRYGTPTDGGQMIHEDINDSSAENLIKPEGGSFFNDNGQLPLHIACEEEQNSEVIKALIRAHPNSAKVKDTNGKLPLHYACNKWQNDEVIKALIKAYPAGIVVEDKEGKMPVNVKVMGLKTITFEVMTEALIETFLKDIEAQDNDVSWPLHNACKNGKRLNVIKDLIARYPNAVSTPDENGSWPLHYACKSGKDDETIEFLTEEFPDALKFPDKDGCWPLHYACKHKNGQRLKVIETLLKEFRGAAMIQDREGRLPLHCACESRQSFEVIKTLIEGNEDGTRVRDNNGLKALQYYGKNDETPLHLACKKNDFKMMEALIFAYPDALSAKNEKGNSPFELDCKGSHGLQFTEFIRSLSSLQEKTNNEDKSSERTRCKRYERVLINCKNHVPLDVLRVGFLDKQTLESKNFLQWLNRQVCGRRVVFMMVLDLYVQIVWIYSIVSASKKYYERRQPVDWQPIVLIACSSLFLMEEISELTRLSVTGTVLHYFLDWWNLLDISTSVMVILSAVELMDEYSEISGLLMVTAFLQSLFLLSYLKKTFFPFSKFVSGVVKIMLALVPFLVVNTLALFTFSFMYFVKGHEFEEQTIDYPMEKVNSFASKTSSFHTVFGRVAGGAEGTSNSLDYVFGVIIIIILLNVVIAVVSDEWAKAVEEANSSFWSYRLDIVIEKTRGNDYLESLIRGRLVRFVNSRLRSLVNGTGILRLYGIHMRRQSRDWETFFEDLGTTSWSKHLDEIFIDDNTAGTTIEEFRTALAIHHREEGTLACFKLLIQSFTLILLGFLTFGLLWPKFVVEIIFTSSNGEKFTDEVEFTGGEQEADDKGSFLNRREEVDFKGLSASNNERGLEKLAIEMAEYRKEVSESLAEYKREVVELSKKVSTQNDLLEQLLKKVS